ncbi:MAG: hypothetical protein Kow0047_11090 [Anaerolineae bacterium]
MVVQDLGAGHMVVSQPAHAWLSAMLAAHWGNERFHRPEPWSELLAAIAIHDNGWLEWEKDPEWLPGTRQPRDFMRMDVTTHLKIWKKSIESALCYSRYAALMVSMHATTLAEWALDALDEPPSVKAKRQTFLGEQRRFQHEVRSQLQAEGRWARWLDDTHLETGLQLLKACDSISLTLCGGWETPATIERVPGDRPGGFVDLTLTKVGRREYVLDPYPFDVSPVRAATQGFLLPKLRDDEDISLRELIVRAAQLTLEFTIWPPDEGERQRS